MILDEDRIISTMRKDKSVERPGYLMILVSRHVLIILLRMKKDYKNQTLFNEI